MVTIRRDQMQAFSEAAAKSFEDRMVVHVGEFFPEQVRALGEPGTREAIRLGIGRAARHDIGREVNVCRFIDIMFAMGARFDEDPAYPWAGRILVEEGQSENAKVDRLYARALAEVWRVACKAGLP
jgi:hypothetical protein